MKGKAGVLIVTRHSALRVLASHKDAQARVRNPLRRTYKGHTSRILRLVGPNPSVGIGTHAASCGRLFLSISATAETMMVTHIPT